MEDNDRELEPKDNLQKPNPKKGDLHIADSNSEKDFEFQVIKPPLESHRFQHGE